MIQTSIIIFLISMLILGVAELLWVRKHTVDSYEKKERINGRFTGAKNVYLVLDDGRVITGALGVFLILLPICILPITILSIFI